MRKGLWIVSLSLLLSATALAAPVGFRSLKIEPGVTASGMGYAYTAVADDPSALYWNPAGLTRNAPGQSALLTHTEWIFDQRMEYAAFVWNRGEDAFGAGISGFYLGGIERRDEDPLAEPLGDFGAYDIVVTAAYARVVGPFRLGLAAKPFYTKIDRVSAHGVALDLGAQWEAPLRGLVLGGAVANLGNEPNYIDEPFSLPVDLRGGAAYQIGLGERDASLLVAAEARKIQEEDTRFHVGADLRIGEVASFRVGYKLGYDEEESEEESYSFGFGLSRDFYSIQYAVVPFSSAAGTVHRFGIGFRR